MSTIIPTITQVDAFLEHRRHTRGVVERTLRGYREELVGLVERGVELSPAGLAEFIGEGRDGQVLAPSTRNRRLVVVRAFCRYLVAQGELACDPTADIRRAKIPRQQRAALGVPDLTRALQVVREGTTGWRRVRDEALLLLLFYTGLRVSELGRLDVHQVDIEHQVLREVLRKGGHHTDVVLNTHGVEAVGAWLKVRPNTTDPALFTGRTGRRLSVRMIQKTLSATGQIAGLPLALHPHEVRHAHATALLRTGADLEAVRQSMNHESIVTTQRYLHLGVDRLRDALEQLPRLG